MGTVSRVAFELPQATSLPPAPSPALDAYLDAALRCIERRGLARTTVPDIARQAGVSRATVYRHLGTMESATRLLLAREIDRILALVPSLVGPVPGPESVLNVMVGIIDYATAHGAWQKVLRDEPELLGPYLVEHLGAVIDRVRQVVLAWLESAMAAGVLAPVDAAAVADWLVRMTVSVLIAPPPGRVRDLLAPMVKAALNPGRPDRPVTNRPREERA
ncbi:MAG: TetR/AcrR family transcriptional regulator [Acidimicrobiales bacterium]